MKLTIIMPVYNEEYLIGKMLVDIVSQVLLEIIEEIIVVDDHSVDTTAQIVSEFAQNHIAFDIKVVSNSTPADFSNALRFRIEKARGDLIIHFIFSPLHNISSAPPIQ
ncbi:MAG: glycosyltransferase [Candidatus Kaelpia imicola]|nr:glycosyltransferase [Candidatus Kaelpia imicola]